MTMRKHLVVKSVNSKWPQSFYVYVSMICCTSGHGKIHTVRFADCFHNLQGYMRGALTPHERMIHAPRISMRLASHSVNPRLPCFCTSQRPVPERSYARGSLRERGSDTLLGSCWNLRDMLTLIASKVAALDQLRRRASPGTCSSSSSGLKLA